MRDFLAAIRLCLIIGLAFALWGSADAYARVIYQHHKHAASYAPAIGPFGFGTGPSAAVAPIARSFRLVRRDVSAMYARVSAAALAHGVPLNIAHAVVRMESGYNPRAMSGSGAWGIGQVLCSTARHMGMTGPCSQLRDPDVNLQYAMTYLRLALDRGGASCAGVSLYNIGIAVRRPICTEYGRRVMALAAR